MRFLLGAVLLLVCVAAMAAPPFLQVSGGVARIVNPGPHFYVCVVVVGGRERYWELYPGHTTVWYRQIDYWECG